MADPNSYRPKTVDIPTNPGVYRFWDKNKQVIYVGKAKNLRARLTTYFGNTKKMHPRTYAMVHEANNVSWTIVGSEIEALQLEYTWIKEYSPKFNIEFRDDKTYPYLAVTLKDTVPCVKIVRGEKQKGIKYFGPYPNPRSIKDTVDLLLRVFPVRTCTNGVFKRAQLSGRPCLLGYIDKCCAPCVGKTSVAEHKVLVTNFCTFMAGKAKEFLEPLQEKMQEAAQSLEYEQAAKFRDDISSLKKALAKSAVVLDSHVDADVFAVADEQLEAAVQVFHVRAGRIRGQRGWVVEKMVETNVEQLLENLLQQFYGKLSEEDKGTENIPREIWVSQLPENSEQIVLWLERLKGSKVDIKVPQRGDKKALLETVSRNAKSSLILHKSKRISDITVRSKALLELQLALKLGTPILRIECFDVSHIQGTNVVASMVVVEDGLPKKSEYRRFIISAAASKDDTAAMGEVIRRRFRNYLQEKQNFSFAEKKFSYAPNLLVVDGAVAQVNAAKKVLVELGIVDVFVCGLAKRLEEVWLAGEPFPVILPRNSQGLFMLQRIRDEAHRFAITFHRKKRSETMLRSVLDEIPGLGKEKQLLLLKHFSSVKNVQKASMEQLQEVKNIGVVLSANIYNFFNDQNRQVLNDAFNAETGEICE